MTKNSSSKHNEAIIYDNFAANLAVGIDVVDRVAYEVIIDSRRKALLTKWLAKRRGKILDYGCGAGYFSKFLSNNLEINTTGVDMSIGLTKYASSKRDGAAYVAADCHRLPFENETFDSIVAVGILHHLDLEKAIFECKRLLKKGGVFIAFEPNLLCPVSFLGRKVSTIEIHTPDEYPITLWSFTDLAIKNGFKIKEVNFLSFFGFIFPFIWASKYSRWFAFLKRFTPIIRRMDVALEKLPFAKYFCWQFGCKCES